MTTKMEKESEREPLLQKTTSRKHSYTGTYSLRSGSPKYESNGRLAEDGAADFQDATNGSDSSNGSGAHCHVQGRTNSVDKEARKKLVIACSLCFFFMTAEIVGGVLANSLAIATDAAHLLTDLASFMISLFSIYLASRPATKQMSFGWWRAEVMGALVSVLLIWVVTGILVYIAVQRVISGIYTIDATIMLITAAVGVGFNLIMGLTLHQGHGHSHGGGGHGHSHGGATINSNPTSSSQADLEEQKLTKDHSHKIKKENINVRAAFIHVLGDLVQSLGVLTAAFLIYFKPEWKIADPICTFVFSVLVLITTLTILRDTLNVLMEGAPRGINFNEVKECFLSIEGVKEVHDLRLWCLTMDKTAVSVHLALEPSSNPQTVLNIAGRMMHERFGIYECTIQTEEYVDSMLDCTRCQTPDE